MSDYISICNFASRRYNQIPVNLVQSRRSTQEHPCCSR